MRTRKVRLGVLNMFGRIDDKVDKSVFVLDLLASRVVTWAAIVSGGMQLEENAKSSKRMFIVVQDVLESWKMWKTMK
ncbi:hypothetical protein EVAR_61214_1 [Eumeta japonica]|uniref:Uncharacterized protein n=1 Tax=Eumeta variegata TaxID=151549 RepID=A0A4C1Z7D8_EUMVA|nr:hypothetical protein EVAR_61214_1 [Eumeta japonica]